MADKEDSLDRPTAPLALGGVEQFTECIANRLPELLERLRLAEPVGSGHPIPPSAGVYLFSEHGKAFYVGQTRNLRKRILQHGGATSRENQASFAFNLARKETGDLAGLDPKAFRKARAAHPMFADAFTRQRARVKAMDLRFVEIDDPALRSVFEVYAALAFDTSEYNSFDTH